MRTSIVFLIMFVLPVLCCAQTTRSDTLIRSAKQKMALGQFDEAIQTVSPVIQQSKKDQDWEQFYNGVKLSIKALKRQKKYTNTRDSIYSWIDDVPIDQQSVIGRLKFNLGLIDLAEGLTYSAILFFQEAASHHKKAGDLPRLALVRQMIANNYGRLNDYETSRSYALSALDIIRTDSVVMNKEYSLVHLIAETYIWQGDAEGALAFLEANAPPGKEDEDHRRLLLADIYLLKNDVSTTMSFLNQVSPEVGSKNDKYLTIRRQIQERAGNYQEAIILQEQICKLMPQTFTRREYFREHVKLATLHYENEDYLTSDRLLDSVLQYYRPADLLSSDDQSKYNRKADAWKARALFLKAQNALAQSDDNIGLESAISYVGAALESLRLQKQFLVSHGERYRLDKEERTYASFALELLYENWRKHNEPDDFDLAFRLSQNSSAAVLKESMGTYDLIGSCAMPDSLVHAWVRLKERLSRFA